jgi:hypothetical protein
MLNFAVLNVEKSVMCSSGIGLGFRVGKFGAVCCSMMFELII